MIHHTGSQHSAAVQAFIAVGSNLSPRENILAAFDALHDILHVTAVARVYRTPPLGPRPWDPPFLNTVWGFRTAVDPRTIKKDILRPLEARLGRVRNEDKNAPRTIDLDLILWGSEVVCAPDLVLPDPDIRRRWFVAAPLLEISPGLILPDTGSALANEPSACLPAIYDVDSELSDQLRRRLQHPAREKTT
jgi:2-amino-4-hydroxy-6-hydroxymethyldihydropteridine diphosphokinase